MRYDVLLVDNDNTLMDFDAAERQALLLALRTYGLPDDEATCAAYHEINDACWKALERGETTVNALQQERFRRLMVHLGRPEEEGCAVAAFYKEHLGDYADLLPGALHLLERLHGRMKIVLVSNGISRTQRRRLAISPITQYLDGIIVSEEVGVGKPDPRIVELGLESVGATDKRRAVFLGDSPTADIAAACAAGVDSIYLDRFGKPCDKATYRVTSLEAAEALLAAE